MKVGDKVRIKKKPQLIHTIVNYHKTAHSIWYEIDESNLRWYDVDELIMAEEQVDDNTTHVLKPKGSGNVEPEKGLRYNEGKLKWSLVSFKALAPMIEVLMFGAKKYGAWNWQKGLVKEEILESAMRHLTAIIEGEETDQESGLNHIGHALCNLMFYSYLYVINVNKVTNGTLEKDK